MKLASFIRNGSPSYGIVESGRIRDLGAGLPGCPSIVEAIAAGLGRGLAIPVGLPEHPLEAVTLTMPVPRPGKILCVGRNYIDHVAEGANTQLPKKPGFFMRMNESMTPHDGPIVRPSASHCLDYEGELAIIVGTSGRAVSKEDAIDHVFGYSCFNDGSIRDYQANYSVLVGKNFPATGGFGPWIVTADELPDPRTGLSLQTRLNGQVMQKSTTDKMIFDVPTILSYVSVFTTLSPGDVIMTGTPEGVGRARDPQVWMQPGDVVEVEIEGIGTLRNHVVAE